MCVIFITVHDKDKHAFALMAAQCAAWMAGCQFHLSNMTVSQAMIVLNAAHPSSNVSATLLSKLLQPQTTLPAGAGMGP